MFLCNLFTVITLFLSPWSRMCPGNVYDKALFCAVLSITNGNFSALFCYFSHFVVAVLKTVLLLLLQFALNPQVLPFYPRSLLSDSCFIKAADSAGGNDVYGDFAWSLEKFCGISDDTALSSSAGDKFHVDRTDFTESWDVPSDLSASSCEHSSGSFDAVSCLLLEFYRPFLLCNELVCNTHIN